MSEISANSLHSFLFWGYLLILGMGKEDETLEFASHREAAAGELKKQQRFPPHTPEGRGF